MLGRLQWLVASRRKTTFVALGKEKSERLKSALVALVQERNKSLSSFRNHDSWLYCEHWELAGLLNEREEAEVLGGPYDVPFLKDMLVKGMQDFSDGLDYCCTVMVVRVKANSPTRSLIERDI